MRKFQHSKILKPGLIYDADLSLISSMSQVTMLLEMLTNDRGDK